MPENQGADPTPVPVTHPLHTVQVAVNTPSHSGVDDLLDYTSPQPLAPRNAGAGAPGPSVRYWAWCGTAPANAQGTSPQRSCAPVAGVLEGLAPLDAPWRRLVAFAARYYQRSLGEVALAALPPQLRDTAAPHNWHAACATPIAREGSTFERYCL
jgi:primosomal protein N' (replication factor Y)